MTKAEFIDALAANFDSKKDAEKVFDIVFKTLDETLTKEGDSLNINSFGGFKVVKRPARTGRNPKTGETINIPEALVLKFKQSKAKTFA